MKEGEKNRRHTWRKSRQGLEKLKRTGEEREKMGFRKEDNDLWSLEGHERHTPTVAKTDNGE